MVNKYHDRFNFKKNAESGIRIIKILSNSAFFFCAVMSSI